MKGKRKKDVHIKVRDCDSPLVILTIIFTITVLIIYTGIIYKALILVSIYFFFTFCTRMVNFCSCT